MWPCLHDIHAYTLLWNVSSCLWRKELKCLRRQKMLRVSVDCLLLFLFVLPLFPSLWPREGSEGDSCGFKYHKFGKYIPMKTTQLNVSLSFFNKVTYTPNKAASTEGLPDWVTRMYPGTHHSVFWFLLLIYPLIPAGWFHTLRWEEGWRRDCCQALGFLKMKGYGHVQSPGTEMPLTSTYHVNFMGQFHAWVSL